MSSPFPQGELRILHWNIHSWLDAAGEPNHDSVIDLIREIDPHVVSLVEVDETWGSASRIEAVAEVCGYSSIFAPVLEYGEDQPRGGFGNALLSRLPITTVRQRQLVWPSTIYDGSEQSELRSVTFAKLGGIWVGTTHLPRGDAEARLAALRRLKNITSKFDSEWLLCGDFNTPASSWLSTTDAVSIAPNPAVPTYPTDEPVEPIDYCVASPNITLNAKVLDVIGSDHLAVVFETTASERHLGD